MGLRPSESLWAKEGKGESPPSVVGFLLTEGKPFGFYVFTYGKNQTKAPVTIPEEWNLKTTLMRFGNYFLLRKKT
jgi:hypothetical protein